MRNSLFKDFENILLSQTWEYYHYNQEINMEMFYDQSIMRSFLRSYLGKGEKSDVEIFEHITFMSEYRLQHTLSCFLLGIVLYEKIAGISIGINKSIKKLPVEFYECSSESFKYIWLLISIFHDFGYSYEDGKTADNYDSLMKELDRRPSLIPNIYSKSLLRNYAKYRLCKFGVNDHGIYGGIQLYSNLKTLREQKEEEQQRSGNSSNKDTKFYWGKDLMKRFSLAAWVIACHNIWLIKDDDISVSCYKCHKLNGLIYSNTSREILKFPFLFLLCLVDSIEPLKCFKDIDALKQLSFEYSPNQLIIKNIGICPKKFSLYKHKIENLNGWLTDIDVLHADSIAVALK